ncbi:J domain-containing protein [Halopiger djelfimassiliensis]|uniref:J domain-containing protein n=1 Tax=Halopiger djelfimassiliensis TaxID=1293047 RepID=UPI00067788D9|nr:J domain-containing protein [Halopiger djelfimassiliensis]
MGETYYDVLDVDPDASQDEITAAYRERVLETHPDHNDDPDAAEQFDRVSTAESVLTDATERARYDRLGHDAYVRFVQQSGPSDRSGADDLGNRSETSTATRSDATNASATRDAREPRGNDRGTTGRSERHRTGTAAGGHTRSHHARHRDQRRRKTDRQRSSAEWPFGAGGNGASGPSRTTATSTDATRSERDAEPTDGSDSQYDVHGWDDEVDIEWEGRPIDTGTAVTVGCIWLCYPLLLFSSLTPLFPTVVNAIVAGCTLVLAGYLLTIPRIATAVFGCWSVLVPVGLFLIAPTELLSLRGLLALGFVWIPFGYALAVWWALRPRL